MKQVNLIRVGCMIFCWVIVNHASALDSTSTDPAGENLSLLEKFAEAQQSWIQGDFSEARSRFAHVAGFRSTSQLTLADKQLIHYSLLRLAQLSEDTERDEWMREARQVDEGFELDAQTFPQGLLSEYSHQEADELNPESADIAKPIEAGPINEPAANPYWNPPKEHGESQVRRRNHWLWIGAGVLATGLAYHLYQESERRERDRVQPQHHYGFR